MLIKDINDSDYDLVSPTEIVAMYKPDFAYIAVPARTHAYKERLPADEKVANRALYVSRPFFLLFMLIILSSLYFISKIGCIK
ncbi:MAG: hypothetical protein JXB24_06210 [Bacteroidales bacterium]|nr:hypothetical protein [Bacteroidales bacterium]